MRLGLAVEGDHHLHRAEDLFLRQAVLVAARRRAASGARSSRRAARRRRIGLRAATFRPLSRASAEIAFDDLALSRRDQRAHVEVGDRRADDAAPGSARPCARRTSSKMRPLDQDARRRRAGLPGVLDAGVDEERQRGVEVGIGEDDLRALAAELERHRHRVLGGRGLDQRADRHRAGERQVLRRQGAPPAPRRPPRRARARR